MAYPLWDTANLLRTADNCRTLPLSGEDHHGDFRLLRLPERISIHERLGGAERVSGSSDRGFGIVFAGLFAGLGLWPLTAAENVVWWCLTLAAAFLAIALVRPVLLAPLNRIWTRFGSLSSKLLNPLIMAILFFLTVTPIGLLMRALGKDPLRLRFDAGAKSYWIERRPPGPDPNTMVNQF